MNYKTLIELPDVAKGTIGIPKKSDKVDYIVFETVRSIFKTRRYNLETIQNNPEWFAPFVLTTEDGVDIYLNEDYYFIYQGKIIPKKAQIAKYHPIKDYYFSTKQAAENYLKQNTFKVGDFINSIRNISNCIKIVDVLEHHYVGENDEQYSKYYARKATNEEIIAYYEKQGWIKGAKFKYDNHIYEVDYLDFDKFFDTIFVWHKKIDKEPSGILIENCILLKNSFPKSWEDLKEISGFNIFENEKYFEKNNPSENTRKRWFKTLKQSQSVTAFAQLSQLVAEMNGDWITDFNDTYQAKYVVKRNSSELHEETLYHEFHPLAFKTAEARDFSFQHHVELWSAFYQL